MSDFYVAVLEANSEGEIFATVPDLPGVNAAAGTQAEALALAIEFANDYVRDLVDEGHPVPKARAIEAIEQDPDAPELARALIPVDVPGKSVKISISIDAATLVRIDRAADKAGMSRSGFFASAAEDKYRQAILASSTAVVGVGGVGAEPVGIGSLGRNMGPLGYFVPGNFIAAAFGPDSVDPASVPLHIVKDEHGKWVAKRGNVVVGPASFDRDPAPVHRVPRRPSAEPKNR